MIFTTQNATNVQNKKNAGTSQSANTDCAIDRSTVENLHKKDLYS